jgi:hypothetical protein
MDEMLSGALTAEDEEEVEAELEALVAASEPASTLPEVPVEEPEELLPSVPTHEPQGETKTIFFLVLKHFILQPRRKKRRKWWRWRRPEVCRRPRGQDQSPSAICDKFNVTFLFCL